MYNIDIGVENMQIYLLLTERCNLRCSYCIRGEKNNSELSVEKLNLLLQANDFSKDQVLLTGGEPLLHENFQKIVQICLQKFKYVAVNTNGLLLDESNIVKNSRIHYQISLDGNKVEHDSLRGEGTFEKVLANLEVLDKREVSYNVSSVINKSNCGKILELIPLLYELKNMKYWKVEPQLPFGCGAKEKCVDVEEWNHIVDLLISETPFRLKIKKLFNFSIIDNLSKEKREELKNRKLSNCGSCKQKIYIYPDLTVYPCTCLKDFPLGNLQYNSLHSILNGEKAKVFIDYKINTHSKCITCRYFEICKSGCIGCSYNVFGKLGMGDSRCPLINK